MNRKHKRLSNSQKLKKTNNQITYFDRLCIRLFLSAVILLILVLLNRTPNIDIKSKINSNANITKIGYQLLSTFIDKTNTETVSLLEQYDSYSYQNNFTLVKSNSYNGVDNIMDGTVIKIEKQNNLYNMTIQTIDNYLITYCGLETIDCYLYEYVKSHQVIGTSYLIDNNYTFKVYISKDKINYSIDNL